MAWYWRLAVIRVLTYMSITAAATFLTLTESYGTNQWNELGDFLKIRILLSCAGAAGTVFVAFMDSTMGELRKTQEGIKPPVIETQVGVVVKPEPEKKD